MVTEELAERGPHLKEEQCMNFWRLFHCTKAAEIPSGVLNSKD